MKIYKKIVGYENYVGERKFNENNKWEGHIVCDENGWFEGIGKDNEKTYKTDKMIFGISSPDENGIFFYKISPRTVCEAHMVAGTQTEEGFDGDIYALSYTGPIRIGLSRIILTEVTEKELPENFEERLERLKEKNDYKSSYESLKDRVEEKVVKAKQYVK